MMFTESRDEAVIVALECMFKSGCFFAKRVYILAIASHSL